MKTLFMLIRDQRAMTHVQSVLENMGQHVSVIRGVEDLRALQWSDSVLLASSSTLEIMRDLNIRSVKTVLIIQPNDEPKLREMCEICDGWIIWSGGEDVIRWKLSSALHQHATLPSYTLSSTADVFQIERVGMLNDHQRIILPMLRDGSTDKEIADKSGFNVPVVKMHMREMFKLMLWRNRTEAALFAERHADLIG